MGNLYEQWFHFLEQERRLTGETYDQICFRSWVSQKDKDDLTAKFNAQFVDNTADMTGDL